MESYSDILRQLADALDADFKGNALQVAARLAGVIRSLILEGTAAELEPGPGPLKPRTWNDPGRSAEYAARARKMQGGGGRFEKGKA